MSKCDKALSNPELELTQKIQMHFPRGIITSEVLRDWNSCPAEFITNRLAEAFSVKPGETGVVQRGLYKVSDTNLAEAIKQAEEFSAKVMGKSVNLQKLFTFPGELPWKNVMLIFDPGYTNRVAVDRALKSQKLNVYEETPVMDYSGSEKEGHPSLYLIENALKPTADTLGDNAKSPDQLADGRTYLTLRGYALAFGLRYHVHKDYLDPETWTWFPKNRLSGGLVADGGWGPRYRRVGFGWGGSGSVRGNCGARLAIPVSLNP